MIMMVISICPIYKTHTKPMHWQSGLYTQANDKDMCWPPRIDHPNGVYFTKQNKHRLKTKKATFNEGTGFWILGERERKLKNCCLKKTWKLLFESKASTPLPHLDKTNDLFALPRSWPSASRHLAPRTSHLGISHLGISHLGISHLGIFSPSSSIISLGILRVRASTAIFFSVDAAKNPPA